MLYFAKFFCAFAGFHCQSFEKVIELEAKKSPSQEAVVSEWKKALFKILFGLLLGVVLSPTYAVQPLPAEQVFQVTTKHLNNSFYTSLSSIANNKLL